MSMLMKYLNITFIVLVLQENKRHAHKGDLHTHIPLLLIKNTKLTFPHAPCIIK